jgi:hypothetical protein
MARARTRLGTRARARPHPRPRQRSTAKGVKRLPKSSFAHPGVRAYPVNTVKRFRAALAYSARSTTSGNPSQIIKAGLRQKNASVRAAAKRAQARRRKR